MIEIILFLVVIIIIYFIYTSQNRSEQFENEKEKDKCNLDIDNLYIYDRDKNYNNYINKVIDNNNNINYTKEEIEIMKNKHQFYNLNNKKNISNLVLSECKNCYGVSSYDIGGGSYYGYNSNVTGGFNSDINEEKGYGDVKGSIIDKSNINDKGNINEKGLCDSNLDNYYYDLNGNNIISTMHEYRKNVGKNNECIPVITTPPIYSTTTTPLPPTTTPIYSTTMPPIYSTATTSDMIIPNTYNINKDLTNAYDVNWQKVLNPLTIY